MIPVIDIRENFLQFLKENIDFENVNDLFLHFDKYIGYLYPKISHTFLRHHYAPDPYSIALQNSFSRKVYNQLSSIIDNLEPKKSNFIVIDKLNIFPIQNSAQKIDFLIIFETISDAEKDELHKHCENLEVLYQLLLNQKDRIGSSQLDIQANLISQYSHDLNSLVELLNETKLSSEPIRFKVEYLEKLIQDILQYVRKLDIYKSSVDLNDLLPAILADINISGKGDFQYLIENDLGKASLDVELISKAIAAIIDNAKRTANKEIGKIDFIAKRKKTTSIFFNSCWLQIIISDNGPGIPNDFIPMITNPFFTTFKDKGCTGFGLSLAEKIVQAHDGFLKFEKSQPAGTKVIIYLPLES